jgi:hypothetical protein
MKQLLRLTTVFLLSAFASAAVAEDAPAEPKITYDDHIKPIFRAKCANCHNTDKKVAGLDLTNYTALMQGGGAGAAIEPGDASLSYLWMLVAHESEPYMPPNSPRLDDATLAVIEEWINLGAPENKGSKVTQKKKVDLSLGGVPTGKPEGPPPMPPRLPLEPVRYTPRADAITAIAASPWAPLVAVGGFNQVLLYHAETLELAGVLPFPEGVPHILRFSRNGKLLLAGGGRGAYQGLAVIWDVTTGERMAEIGDETDAVLAADISPDQQLVALGGPNRKVKVYSTQTGEQLYELTKHTEWVYALEFSPDNVLLATADRNGGLYVWEALTGTEFHVLDGHKSAVNAVSWRPDSNLLASCDDEGQIRLWEMEEGKQVKNWAAHGGGTKSVEFTRDGRLISAGVDKTAKLWSADGNQQHAFPAFADVALGATYAAEGDRVFAGDWTGEIRVWNAADAAQVGTIAANPPTIQMRLDQAMAALPEAKKKFEQATTAFTAAEAAAKESEAAIAKVQAELAAAESARHAAEEQAKAIAERLTKLREEQAKASEATKRSEQMAASLKTALDHLQAARNADPDAADLAIAATGIEAALAARLAQVATLKAAAESATQQLAPISKESETANAAVATAAKALEAVKAKLPPLEADLQGKQEQLATAQQAREEAQQALTAAEAAVKRWQEELAFARQVENAQASLN